MFSIPAEFWPPFWTILTFYNLLLSALFGVMIGAYVGKLANKWIPHRIPKWELAGIVIGPILALLGGFQVVTEIGLTLAQPDSFWRFAGGRIGYLLLSVVIALCAYPGLRLARRHITAYTPPPDPS